MSSEWTGTTIGEQLTLQRGFDITKATQQPGAVPVISSGGTNSNHSTAMVKGPGVVLGRKGIVGSVYFVKEDYWPHDTTLWVKDFHGNDELFAYYFFLAKAKDLAQLDVGSANPTLNRNHVHPIRVQFPPLYEQRLIGRLLGSLDDRITLLRETNATLEAIGQALFKSWFVDFDPVRTKAEGRQPEGMDATTAALFPDSFEESELGLVPKGWRVGTVSDLGEVICGKTPPTAHSENYGDDVPFITIPDMHGRLLVTSTNRSLSRLGADTQRKKYLPAGSICVSCIATPGLVVRVTSVAQTNQQINSVVPFERWGKSFPLFLLRRIGDAVRAGGSGGSVFHNLSKSGFEELKVLLVSEDLAQRFDEIVEPLITNILKNQRQSETLTQLRDTLLPRLISGQLRLPDAEHLIEEAC